MWIAVAVSGYTNSSGQQSTLCAELCLCNRVLAELCRRMSLEKPESDYSAPAQALLSPALAWLPHTWHQPRNAGNSQRGRYFIYLKVIPSLNAYFCLSFLKKQTKIINICKTYNSGKYWIVKKIKTSTKLRTKQLVRDAVYPLSTLPPTLTSPLSPNRNRFKRIKFSLLNLNTSAHTHTLYCFIQNLTFWNTKSIYYCDSKC